MVYDLSGMMGPGLIAGLLALGAVALIVGLALYIYTALALMSIARKTNTKNAWLAWIPIADFYLVTQMAKKSGWWTLMVLAPMVPAVGSLAFAIVGIWMFWMIAKKVRYPGWTSLLLIIPLVNLVILGIWAWAKK